MKISDSMRLRLEVQHLSIPELIDGMEEYRIFIQPAPGKWSIHDNIAHLARYNVVFQERIKTILTSDKPQFPRYKAEEDIEFPSWQSKKTAELITNLKTDRKKIFDSAIDLPEKDLERIGVHPKFGALDIIGWLDFFLLHEAHHIFTIFQLKNDVTLGKNQ